MKRLGVASIQILGLSCQQREQMKGDIEGLSNSLEKFPCRLALSTLNHRNEARVGRYSPCKLPLGHVCQ
jgi:hypothetical protein